jgi:hypothetical protein
LGDSFLASESFFFFRVDLRGFRAFSSPFVGSLY